MKSSKSIQLSIVTSVAASLLSCSSPPQQSARYCVDANQSVVDPANCEAQRPGYRYYYASSPHGGGGVYPIGSRVYGGTYSAPSTGATSGTVRGGMGSAGEAASGHAGGGGGGE